MKCQIVSLTRERRERERARLPPRPFKELVTTGGGGRRERYVVPARPLSNKAGFANVQEKVSNLDSLPLLFFDLRQLEFNQNVFRASSRLESKVIG